MNLTKNCQKKRLAARHGDEAAGGFGDVLSKMYDMYEPAGEDEEGAYNLTITEDMTPDDVLKNALEIIAKIPGTSVGEGKTPWRNGYYASPDMPAFLWVVDGEKLEGKNMIALDYPDIKGGWPCTLKHGNFGPPRKEVAEATGAKYNNIEMDMMGLKLPGVVNESGTKFTMWGMANKLDTMNWLSPEEVKKARENRDDFDAPR